MNKKIVITGANGQLGREISRQLAGKYELIKTDIADSDDIKSLDITSVDQVLDFVREVKPYAIINCAAYTAVDAQEKDVDMSYKINAIGPRNLAIAGSETDAKLVHVSTDYVFAGDADKPYTEFDKTGPVSTYGRTKLAGEKFVETFSDKFFTVRTAWLYGDGKNFVKTMLRLSESHDKVSVVDDQVGSPTSTAELAAAISYLLPTDNYGLFHGTCEGSCSWADFTDEIFRLAGKATTVEHVSTARYMEMNPASAKRPAYSILDNYMLRLTGDYMFADWHDAIAKYIKDMQ